MSASLHEQLADELGVDANVAQSALQEFFEDVRARAESGDAVEIPGLGTVSADEGEVQLTPSEPLQQAVNYRNAHLEPLTVTEGSGEPAPADDDENDKAMAESAEKPPFEEETEEDVVPDLSDEWTTELDDESTEEPSSDEASQTMTEDEGASTGQVAGLVAAVALLFLALGYVITSQGLLPGFGPAAESAATAPPSAPDTTAARATPDTSSTAESAPPADPTPSAAQQSIDRAQGGWTIVVASRTQPGEAKAVLTTYRQRFRGEGLPTDILTGESNGQLRYRITVGQYDSRQAAMTASQQLAGRIPADAWPLEIQPGS